MYPCIYIYISVDTQTICIPSRCLDIYIHILNSTPPWWGNYLELSTTSLTVCNLWEFWLNQNVHID